MRVIQMLGDPVQSPPPGWGRDKLSDFIEAATGNSFATFHNKKKEYQRLKGIDDCFETLIPNLINRPELICAMLMARCHSTYRGAVRLAISGQCPETFSLLRTAIESALYALRIYKVPGLDEVWLKRHEDDASLEKAKREFSYRKAIGVLTACNKHHSERMDAFYQRCIDFGAHPNEMSVTGSMTINESDKAKEILQKYLDGDGMALDHALKSTAQIGLGLLYIFRHIYKERFDLLGVTDEMESLRNGI